ncbi:MAG: type III pantothenate kinase [Candidatus Omnitrophica bacterium]|nr:type III pantothenate kinase [Candidatus Omnitrophota bacterium]
MILTMDIGNTNTNIGIYSKNKLIKKYYYPGNFDNDIKIINRIYIVSVNPDNLRKVLMHLAKNFYKGAIQVIGKDIKVPIKSNYNIKEIGQDRLVTAYAAKELYKEPVLIIDFGTAVTFDVVTKEGIYDGGLIFPGIKMSLQSLNRNTVLLPEVELVKVDTFIGRNTKTSIRSGIIHGYVSICEAMIKKFKKEYPGIKTVVTGGNATFLSHYTTSLRNINENLCLEGLRLLAIKQEEC